VSAWKLWLRFLILLFIKPAASTLARFWLMVKMRRTLLGKKTMHGTSQIAAQIIVERQMKLCDNVDQRVQAGFNYREEELAAVQDELRLSGLNFNLLRAKLMRKWHFFVAVVLLQLFSAFPCSWQVPAGIDERWTVWNATAVTVNMEPLPLSSSWYYVPPKVAHRLAKELRAPFAHSIAASKKPPGFMSPHYGGSSADYCVSESSYTGWPVNDLSVEDREIIEAAYVYAHDPQESRSASLSKQGAPSAD